jgi:uroporphyrinogen-III synthase
MILPKARTEWLRWQSALSEVSVNIHWIDPWAIELLPETPKVKQAWLDLDQNKVVICVSPTAAQALIDGIDQYWPMPPSGVHWLCNGPRTAAVIQQFGLPVEHPETGYTAEDVMVLAKPLLQSYDACLIVKGVGGRNAFKDYLSAAGQKVTEVEVYQRSVNQSVLAEMVRYAETSRTLWLSSSFLGEALLEQNGDFWRSWSGEWWVSSSRLEHWCLENGLVKVRQAAGATVEALAKMLRNEQGEL